MTDQQHRLTPSPELVRQWLNFFHAPCPAPGLAPGEATLHIANVAARWGADQELEACCAYLAKAGLTGDACGLQLTRRPKPPSLKEQALAALQEAAYMADDSPPQGICADQIDIIRRALEQLDD